MLYITRIERIISYMDSASLNRQLEKIVIKITVNTQHGTGGSWVTDFESSIGPINLMRAVKAPTSGQRGVGGYHTNLQIGDVVIDQFELQDLTLEKARKICANPEDFQPPEYVE